MALIARLAPWTAIAVLGFAVQTAVLLALVHALEVHYVVAAAAAIGAAVLHNFLWHERWTWADRPAASAAQRVQRLIRFAVLTGAVSVAGGVALMALLVEVARLPLAAANLAAVILLGVVNLAAADRLAFTPSPQARAGSQRAR